MQKMDGMNYAPVASGLKKAVVKAGTFFVSVIGLDHGHIYGIVNGLLEAGATLSKVFDPDEKKIEAFISKYPQAKRANREEEILSDESCSLIASAIRPDKRAELAVRSMKSGKHFFVDKPGFLELEDVEAIDKCRKETGKKFFVYFSERIHVEGSVCAQELIQSGALGKILNIVILAPHRLNAPTRPDWFFDSSKNGSILIDLGSHQVEQFLTFSGSKTAKILYSNLANFSNKEHKDFYDFGECLLEGDNGCTCFFKVDWFTPSGLGAWGDGRVFITGTKASLEIRKYLDVANSPEGDHVYFVDSEGEHFINAHGKYGFEYFGNIILDCLNGTDKAIDPGTTLEAMRITIEASRKAHLL